MSAESPEGKQPTTKRRKRAAGTTAPKRNRVTAGKKTVQLSPREHEVLLRLLKGESRKKIAEQLNLSEHTVGDYLKQLHKRFAVNTRAQLLAHFIPQEQRSS